MNDHIYTNDSVGRIVNSDFISVQIQMDSTKLDKGETKNWYATAHHFLEQYHVNAYPFYLFFSPSGRIVHAGTGTKDVSDFIRLCRAAQNAKEQYYTILGNYNQGHRDYTTLPYLIECSLELKNEAEATHFVHEYVHQYLEKLPSKELWTKQNLQLMEAYSRFMVSKDKLFQLYFRNHGKIDSIVGEEKYSEILISSIIYREEVAPKVNMGIKMSREPNWKKIRRTIGRKYSAYYGEKYTVLGKMRFYKARKEWSQYIANYIEWQEENGMVKIKHGLVALRVAKGYLNDCAWEVFKYSTNKKELTKALLWVESALSMNSAPDPVEMDTKANLLYKLGIKEEAILLEEKSSSLAKNDNEIQQNLRKMKQGVPTWGNN